MNEQLAMSPNDPRIQIPLSVETRVALTPLIRAMIRVITTQSLLAKEEAIFGSGTDHVPKSAGPVLLRYYQTKIGRDSVEVRFERQAGEKLWSLSSFAILSWNFPQGVYAMELPATFFDDLRLEAKLSEERPTESLKRVNVFRYRLREGASLQLDFEARGDVASLDTSYPRSFHQLTIRRIE